MVRLEVEGLHGRELETAAIERALAVVQDGSAPLACISGEPGIGKTRLLSVLGERARSRGMLVLEGSGAEFEQSVPFGPFVDALDDHLSGLDRRSLERVGADDLARLALLLPSLGRRPHRAAVESGEGRHRTLSAVRSLLEALATRRPLASGGRPGRSCPPS